MRLPRRLVLVAAWCISLAAAFLAGAFAHRDLARLRALFRFQVAQPIETVHYTLRVRKVPVPGEGRDGGIAAVPEGVLYVNRSGRAWLADRRLRMHALPLRVPINVDAFMSDPYNATTAFRDRFAVKDIAVREHRDSLLIAASYLFWHLDSKCNSLRVSMLSIPRTALRPGAIPARVDWRVVFESDCRELTLNDDSVTRHVTLGAGGRLEWFSEDELLLTSGEFSLPSGHMPVVDTVPPHYHGKTIVIALSTGEARLFTWGHRNPQGLARAPDGRFWLTEHGARGGDELNLLAEGAHYGFPHVSYGTQYEMMVWPRSTIQGRHEGYRRPVHAWVPGIGISQLVVAGDSGSPLWSGQLLVGSLATRSLYRIAAADGRALFVEAIPIGHRIRDIVQTRAGTLVLLTDDNLLVFLENRPRGR
jgi:hypothetical protein